MGTTRTKFSPDFKAKVALAAIRGEMLSLVKTNGKSRHGERLVSRIANRHSCHGEPPLIPQRPFPCSGIIERFLLLRPRGVKL